MININRYTLSNGLRVIHNEDNTTQMVALNLLYDVGARDEDPDHTGFAHLFEHLMFGGSVHVPDYDTPVQNAGGENNAWSNNDITNYYITLPRQNVETGFWLESDRMLSLDFNPRSLEVQRQVVIEEFKQRNLNLVIKLYQTGCAGYDSIDSTLFHRVIKQFMIQAGDCRYRHAGRSVM